MSDSIFSSPISPIEELTTLFATGILRLKSRKYLASELSPNLSESPAKGLEFPVEFRLTVPTG